MALRVPEVTWSAGKLIVITIEDLNVKVDLICPASNFSFITPFPCPLFSAHNSTDNFSLSSNHERMWMWCDMIWDVHIIDGKLCVLKTSLPLTSTNSKVVSSCKVCGVGKPSSNYFVEIHKPFVKGSLWLFYIHHKYRRLVYNIPPFISPLKVFIENYNLILSSPFLPYCKVCVCEGKPESPNPDSIQLPTLRLPNIIVGEEWGKGGHSLCMSLNIKVKSEAES